MCTIIAFSYFVMVFLLCLLLFRRGVEIDGIILHFEMGVKERYNLCAVASLYIYCRYIAKENELHKSQPEHVSLIAEKHCVIA